jgi:hypothetical protein
VSPSVGVSRSDLFTMKAKYWSDVDLPMSYTFGYLSHSESLLVVGSKSVTTSSVSVLPEGTDSDAYALTCCLLVFDSLDARGTDLNDVVVTPNSSPLNATEMGKPLAVLAASGSTDAMASALAVYSSALTAVSCTDSPDCSLLNRNKCTTTKNTCGKCLTSAYVGTDGHYNSKCVLRNESLAVTTDTVYSTHTCRVASIYGVKHWKMRTCASDMSQQLFRDSRWRVFVCQNRNGQSD